MSAEECKHKGSVKILIRNLRRMKERGFSETKDLIDGYDELKKQNAELNAEIKLRDEFIENLLSFEDSIGDNWFFIKDNNVDNYKTVEEAWKAYTKKKKDER